jgi:hypothetical protein
VKGTNNLLWAAIWPFLNAWVITAGVRLTAGFKPRYREAYLAALLPVAALYITHELIVLAGAMPDNKPSNAAFYYYTALILQFLSAWMVLRDGERRPLGLWPLAFTAFVASLASEQSTIATNAFIDYMHNR